MTQTVDNPMSKELADLFCVDSDELAKQSDLYTYISEQTGLPRQVVKQTAYHVMYSTRGSFAEIIL